MKYCEFCRKEFLDSEGLKLGGHKTNCKSRSKEYFEKLHINRKNINK